MDNNNIEEESNVKSPLPPKINFADFEEGNSSVSTNELELKKCKKDLVEMIKTFKKNVIQKKKANNILRDVN